MGYGSKAHVCLHFICLYSAFTPPTKPFSRPTSSMDPEEAQRLIDEEIRVLKTRRNTYARISRLPNEVLAEIFAVLRKSIGGYCRVLAWHHVTHICRHWRRVALEFATLWTSPPTALHEYTLLMLERSRTSPLDIDMFPTTSYVTCTAVLGHIGRIESLVIEQSALDLQIFQHSLALAQAAPLLKTLEISKTSESLYVFRLSASLFHQIPSLSTLSLAGIDFDWIIFPLRNLTSLSLDWLAPLSEPPSWTQFYSALRQMPSLEDLAFRFDDLQLISPPHHPEPLQLPHLHTLVINNSRPSVIRSFISNSSFPRLRYTLFECSFADLDDYSATIGVLLPLITKGNFGCLDRLGIGKDHFMLTDEADRHHITVETYDWHDSSAIGTARAVMARLADLPANPIPKIVKVVVLSVLSSEQLLELFGHLPQLESIVGRDIDSQIIECLKILPLHPLEAPIPFPKVNSVEIIQYPRRSGHYTPELFEDLHDCLMQRHTYGAAVSKLSLHWRLTQEEVQRLLQFVDDVGWHGSEPSENLQDDDDSDEEEESDSD